MKKQTRVQIFSSREEMENRVDINGAERIKAGRKTLCIARNQNGFYAMEDECPHQGASLAKGFCNNEGEIICPWHHHPFNLKTGKGRGEYVDVYPLEITEKGVFVLLPQSAWDLFSDLF
jgi:nitrite reductase/ring-hydroxylating ferredoxin subunit